MVQLIEWIKILQGKNGLTTNNVLRVGGRDCLICIPTDTHRCIDPGERIQITISKG